MRNIFTLSLLLLATAASARQISPQEARNVADDFFSNSGTKIIHAPTRGEENPQPYYVFNAADNNGFVIISGDDRFSKVLGYSDRGSFDATHMPPQLKAMLENFAKNTTKPSNFTSTHPSWNTTFSTRADEGVLLETAEWGQDAPFNAETPMFGDQHAPTGCVATAMAIVMKYHSWPETYNWDAMPMKIESDEENPPAANPELARLMKDAGEAVFMRYGEYESGANMNWVGHRLQQVFKYSPDCQYITKQNFSNEEWVKMIQENLNAGNPVIYQGTDKGPMITMNHAFIIDGYNSKGYHVNWGWDGWFNGYFALDALTPNDDQDFSFNNGLVLNIVPDKSGKEYSECFIDYGYFWVGAGNGTAMNLSVENVKKGEPFHLINTLINIPKGFEGLVGLALVDKNDKIKEILQTQNHSTYISTTGTFEDIGTASNFAHVTVSGEIEPTDRLQIVTKNKNDSEFKLVLGTLEWPSSISVVNNTPQYGKVKIEVGENIHFEYANNPYEIGDKPLSVGTTELTPLIGSTVFFTAKVDKPETDEIAVVTVRGKKVIGLGNFAGEFINYSIDVSDDAAVTAKAVKLSDKSLNITTAGTLKDLISTEDALTIKKLTISGKMNAEDFWFIRNHCTSLHSLNIKTVDIEAITIQDEGADVPKTHTARVIPEEALSSLGLLEELILPDNIVGIGDNSLCGLNLKKLSIPSGVEFIGINALYANKNLEAVEILNPTPFEIRDCVFHVTAARESGILFVPKGSGAQYREVEDWKNFKRIVEGPMPENVLTDLVIDGIKYHCLYDEAAVSGYEGEPKNIVLPKSVQLEGRECPITKIKDYAFPECQSIESVILSENIVEIGERSFFNCKNLKSVKLNDNLKIIGREAFGYSFNLEECDLPKGIESLGIWAFQYTNLKRVFIPKNAVPQNDLSVFGANGGLDKFIVEDGNPYFKSIDGVLYRITEEGLILESIPGKIGESVYISDGCVRMREYAGVNLNNVKNVFFNKDLKVIERWTLGGQSIEHVTLPSNANIDPEAWSLQNLKSVTFTGNVSFNLPLFPYSWDLNNLIIESPDEVVELDGIFAEPKECVNIFTASAEKNFNYSGKYKLFVAGGVTDGYEGDEAQEVQEMWGYGIDREEKVLTITPQVDRLAIERVLVNGKEAENIYSSRAETTPAFVCAVDDLDNLNVTVEYSLFGSQKMSCEYKSEFNAELPHTPSGVSQVWIDSSVAADVYTTDGLLIRKAAGNEALNDLRPGVYVIRQGNKTRKVIIRK